MILWVTGNSKSGKTTLAMKLAGKGAVLLDGDAMRQTINRDLGFSRMDRFENNLRIARLAKLIEQQGFPVIVSTICPYEKLRQDVKTITGCQFIYVTGGRSGDNYPYEVPSNPDVVVKGNDDFTEE